MLDVSVIGIGNCGSQIAALAMKKLNIPVLAINSSERDLQTLPKDVPSFMIGDAKGAGKERSAAKEMLKSSIMTILNDDQYQDVFAVDVIFIVSSTGGGTGSGTSILMTNIIREVFTKCTVVTIGVLPTLKEALSTQLNSVEYLKELYDSMGDNTYMLYDNDRLPKTAVAMMQSVNEQIVKDIDVLRGTYQVATKYSSIDERDMLNIINTPGRLVVAGVENIDKRRDVNSVDIEAAIIESLKTSAIADLDRDGIVARTGVISVLNEELNDGFDTHIPKVTQTIGTPVESFEHIAVLDDRHLPSNVFLVCSGMSKANDRLRKISERIDEINEAQAKSKADESAMNDIDFTGASQKVAHTRKKNEAGSNVDLKDIFSKFGV